MKRPAFKVTGGVVVMLSLLGLLKVVSQPLLPRSESDPLITLPASEQLPAAVLDMNWQPNAETAFKNAKRDGKGVLVFLASPVSFRARILETEVFRDPEIVRFARRHFYSLKVNLEDFGELENMALPLTRSITPFEPGATILTFAPSGEIVDAYGYRFSEPVAVELVRQYFVRAKREIEVIVDDPKTLTSFQDSQDTDFRRLASLSGNPIPDRVAFIEPFLVAPERQLDPFNLFGTLRVNPLVIRTLLLSGQVSAAANLADSVLTSPLFDPIDGGFFESVSYMNSVVQPDTGKLLGTNSLWMEILAELYVRTNRPEFRDAALMTATSIMTDFNTGDGLLSGMSNDIQLNGKSVRYSLTLQKLRQILEPGDVEWVSKNLLGRRDNSRLIGWISDVKLISDPKFNRIRNVLRSKLPKTESACRSDRTSSTSYALARLLKTGAMLKRDDIIEFVENFLPSIDATFDGYQVFRFIGRIDNERGWLRSYLAAADCYLQHYLSTRRLSSLETSVNIFRMTLTQFENPALRQLVCNPLSPEKLTVNTPQIVDIDGESTTAISMRLAAMLSLLASNSSDREDFRLYASKSAGNLAPILSQSGSGVAGYFSTANLALLPYAVITRDNLSTDKVLNLTRQNGLCSVIPIISGVRSDWRPQKSGLYIARGEQINGPFTEQELTVEVEKLTQTLP